MAHRKSKTILENQGDFIRYGGDILDYLVLADLVEKKLDGKYYPKLKHLTLIYKYIENDRKFTGYDAFYGQDMIDTKDIEKLRPSWFSYANEEQNEIDFKSDILTILEDEVYEEDTTKTEKRENKNKIKTQELGEELNKFLQEMAAQKVPTKQIGDLGEALAIQHERNRILKTDLGNLIHKINKIPDSLAVGYDIRSYLGKNSEPIHITIEVKTTISKNKLTRGSFTLTQTELEAAKSYKGLYFVYRISISSTGAELFVINDPVAEAEKSNLKMSVNNNLTAHIAYSNSAGNFEKILL